MKEYNNSEESEEEIITTTKKQKKTVQVNDFTEMPSFIMDSRVKYNEEIINLPKADDIIKSKNEIIEEINTDIKEERENKLTDEEIKKIIEEINTEIKEEQENKLTDEENKKRNDEIEKIKQGAEKKMLNKKDKKYLSYLDEPYENEDTLERDVSMFNTYMLVNMPNTQTMMPNRRNYFLKNRILKTLSEKEIRAQKFYQDMVQIAKHQTNKQKFTTFSFYSKGAGGKLLVTDKITTDKMEIVFYIHNKPGGGLSHTFGHCCESYTYPPDYMVQRNAQEYGATISKIFKMLQEDVPNIKIDLSLSGESLGTHLMMKLCNTVFKDIDFKKLNIIWQQIPTARIVRTNYAVRPEQRAIEMFTFLKSRNILQLFKEKNENVSIHFIVSNGKTITQETFHTPKGSFVFFNKLEKLIEDDETLKPDDRNLLKNLMHNSKMLFNSNFPETFMRFLKDVLDKNQLDIEPCDMLTKYNIYVERYGNKITKECLNRIKDLLKNANVSKELIKGDPSYTVKDFIEDYAFTIAFTDQNIKSFEELGLQLPSEDEKISCNICFSPYYLIPQANKFDKKMKEFCEDMIDFKKFIYAMQLKKKLKTQHQAFYQKAMESPYIYAKFMKKILVQQLDVDNVVDKLNNLEDIAESYNIWINPTDTLTDKFNILRDIHLNHFEKMKSAIFEKNDPDNEKLRKEKLLKQIIVQNFYSCPQNFVLTPSYVENFITYAKYCIKYHSLALLTPAEGESDFPLHKDFNYDFKPEDAQKIDSIIHIKQELYKKIKQFIVNATTDKRSLDDKTEKKTNSFFAEDEYDISGIFAFPSLDFFLFTPSQQKNLEKFNKLTAYIDILLSRVIQEVGSVQELLKRNNGNFADFFTNMIIHKAEQNFPEINSEEEANKFADFCAKSFTIFIHLNIHFFIEYDLSYNTLETEKEKTKFENLYTMAKNFTTISQGIQEAIKPETLATCHVYLKRVIEDRVKLGDVPDSFSNDMAREYGKYIGKLALLKQFSRTNNNFDIYTPIHDKYNFNEIMSNDEKKRKFKQIFNTIKIYKNYKEEYIKKHKSLGYFVQKRCISPLRSSQKVIFNNAILGALPIVYHNKRDIINDYISKICDIDDQLSLLKEFSYTEFQKPENQNMYKCIFEIKKPFVIMLHQTLSECKTNEEKAVRIRKLCQNVYKNFNDISCIDEDQTMKNCGEILQYTNLQLFIEQMYSDDTTLKEAILADLPSYKEFKDNKTMQLYLVSILENQNLVQQHYQSDRKNKKHWLKFMSNIFDLYETYKYNKHLDNQCNETTLEWKTQEHIDTLYNFLFNTSNLGQFVEETLQDQQCQCKDFLLLCLMVSSNDISLSEDRFSQRYSLEKIFNAFDLIFKAKTKQDEKQLESLKANIKHLLSSKPTSTKEKHERLCDIFGFIFGKADILSRCRIEEAKDLLYIVEDAERIKQGTMSVEKNEELKSSSIDNQNEDKEEDKKIESIKEGIISNKIFKKIKNSAVSLNPKKGFGCKKQITTLNKEKLFKTKNNNPIDTLNKGKEILGLETDEKSILSNLNKK